MWKIKGKKIKTKPITVALACAVNRILCWIWGKTLLEVQVCRSGEVDVIQSGVAVWGAKYRGSVSVADQLRIALSVGSTAFFSA